MMIMQKLSLETVMNKCKEICASNKHRFITTVHLFDSILQLEPLLTSDDSMEKFGINYKSVRTDIDKYYKSLSNTFGIYELDLETADDLTIGCKKVLDKIVNSNGDSVRYKYGKDTSTDYWSVTYLDKLFSYHEAYIDYIIAKNNVGAFRLINKMCKLKISNNQNNIKFVESRVIDFRNLMKGLVVTEGNSGLSGLYGLIDMDDEENKEKLYIKCDDITKESITSKYTNPNVYSKMIESAKYIMLERVGIEINQRNIEDFLTNKTQGLVGLAINTKGAMEVVPKGSLIEVVFANDNNLKNLLDGVGGFNKPDNIKNNSIWDFSEHNYADGSTNGEEGLLDNTQGSDDTATSEEETIRIENSLSIVNLSRGFSKNKTHYIGREDVINECIDNMSKFRKSNIIITGESGVGKTSLVYGIMDKVYRIPSNDYQYSKWNDAVFIRLDTNSMLSNTKYRGQLEGKVSGALKYIKKTYTNPVVFIDEAQNLYDNSKGDSDNGFIRIIKEFALSSGTKMVMTCTNDAYLRNIKTDVEFDRRFTQINLTEPTKDEAVDIIYGIKRDFEKYHDIKYTQDNIKAIVDLSSKYINDKYLPDKAIDLMDEIGVYCKKKRVKEVTSSIIDEYVAKKLGIPVKNMSRTEVEKLKNLESELKGVVFGQDDAVRELARVLRINKTGLTDDNKTIENFMFVGPTGVGKTELAKQLASTMGLSFIKFDMSEYSEITAVNKFIGSAPGYESHNQGGELVNRVKANPNSVILFDEIEKAHPNIYNLMLQIMDDAKLTDGRGITADFRNCIIIMTSNSGAEDSNKNSIGFGSMNKSAEIISKAVESNFKPEFLGRMNVIQFNSLNNDMQVSICDKFMGNIKKNLMDNRKIGLAIGSGVNSYILDLYNNSKSENKKGARGIISIINKEIKTLISDRIIDNDVKEYSTIVLGIKDGNLDVDIV